MLLGQLSNQAPRILLIISNCPKKFVQSKRLSWMCVSVFQKLSRHFRISEQTSSVANCLSVRFYLGAPDAAPQKRARGAIRQRTKNWRSALYGQDEVRDRVSDESAVYSLCLVGLELTCDRNKCVNRHCKSVFDHLADSATLLSDNGFEVIGPERE